MSGMTFDYDVATRIRLQLCNRVVQQPERFGPQRGAVEVEVTSSKVSSTSVGRTT